MNYCKNILKVKTNYRIKEIIFICIFLCAHTLCGQHKESEINHVTYKIQLNKNLNNKAPHYDALISNLELKMEQVTFDLDYNDSISRFTIRNNSLSEEDNNVIMDIADMLGKECYSRTNSNISLVGNIKFSDYKGFTVYSFINTEWVITDEKKIINGYECSKAFTTVKKDYGDGKENSLYELTAWFAPDIKDSFGPKSFKGLPGMILELEQNLVIFKANKIDYNRKSNKLAIPIKNLIPESEIY